MAKIVLKDCRLIATQNKKREILENKSIVIDGNSIRRICDFNLLKDENLDDFKIFDMKDAIIIPGLINSHTHSSMNLFRGVGSGLKLDLWLKSLWKEEAKLTSDDIYSGSIDAFSESIRSGVTTIVDMYFGMDQIYEAAKLTGLRAFLGYGMIDLFDSDKRKKEISEEKKWVDFIIEKEKENNHRIKPIVMPHALNTCSKELLLWAKKYAEENNLVLGIHAAESLPEVEFIYDKYGKEITDFVKEIGYFENSILFHGVHLDYGKVKNFSGKNFSVVNCPSSNLKLLSGVLDLRDVSCSGISFGLGTDGAASNNNLDILEEMKISAMLYDANRIIKNDDAPCFEQEIFDSVTVNPAKFLKINAGCMCEGKLADIVVLRTNMHMSNTSKNNLVSNIVYSANSDDVKMTIIDGNIRYVI